MKNKLIFVNYSSNSFKKNKKVNNLFVKTFIRPDVLLSYTDTDLHNTAMYREHKELFDSKIGGGYWAWKPWVILEAMKNAKSGDIVLYSDCGTGFKFKPFTSCKSIIDYANQNEVMPGVMVPEYGPNRLWTHKKCFEKMGCDSEKYWNSYQTEATISCWKVTEENIKIVKEWLHYVLDYNVVSNEPITESLVLGYALNGHRHDQSVLTNLVIKHSLKPVKQNENSNHLFKSLTYLDLYLRKTRSSLLVWRVLNKLISIYRLKSRN